MTDYKKIMQDRQNLIDELSKKFTVGTWVTTKVEWPHVARGTIGLIVEDYGSGIMVAWDLPKKGKPIPRDKTPEEIGKMWAVNPECPIRDGFDKKEELHYLLPIDKKSGPGHIVMIGEKLGRTFDSDNKFDGMIPVYIDQDGEYTETAILKKPDEIRWVLKINI